MNDYDRCRVSEEELAHDMEQERDSELYAEAERVAERMIGNFDEIGDLISALANAEDNELLNLAKKIRERDPSVLALLQFLKVEFVKQILENQGEQP